MTLKHFASWYPNTYLLVCMIVELNRGEYKSLIVKPRWILKKVAIDADVLDRIEKVANELSDLRLVITRAFESETKIISVLRKIGRKIFRTAYFWRKNELDEIFSPNGHNIDGRHVDISICQNGKILNLLPLSVFTPLKVIEDKENDYKSLLLRIEKSFEKVGGTFHKNRLERLQIHVDFAR